MYSLKIKYTIYNSLFILRISKIICSILFMQYIIKSLFKIRSQINKHVFPSWNEDAISNAHGDQ